MSLANGGDAVDPQPMLYIGGGIYIDFPPSIKLSLPSGDEACLFRRKTSPITLLDHDEPQVLLKGLAIAYHEPLSFLFQALRQEPRVRRIAGLSEAELVLDIIALDLTIEEVGLTI